MAKATAFTLGTLLADLPDGHRHRRMARQYLGAADCKRPTLTRFAPPQRHRAAGGTTGRHARHWQRSICTGCSDISAVTNRWPSRWSSNKLRLGQMPVEFLMLYFGLPAALLLPPTFLMGFCFPILQRIVQTDFARLRAPAWGTDAGQDRRKRPGHGGDGCHRHSMFSGTAGTMKALALVSILFAFATLGLTVARRAVPVRDSADRRVWCSPSSGERCPMSTGLWARLHGAAADRIIVGEDATGLSVVRLEPSALQKRSTVFVNGVGQSTIPYGDIHTALGMLPAFLHPAPRDVAIIGLGSGDTVYGVAGRPDITSITCVEIIGATAERAAPTGESPTLRRPGRAAGRSTDSSTSPVTGEFS